jgi:hypothetical protein
MPTRSRWIATASTSRRLRSRVPSTSSLPRSSAFLLWRPQLERDAARRPQLASAEGHGIDLPLCEHIKMRATDAQNMVLSLAEVSGTG